MGDKNHCQCVRRHSSRFQRVTGSDTLETEKGSHDARRDGDTERWVGVSRNDRSALLSLQNNCVSLVSFAAASVSQTASGPPSVPLLSAALQEPLCGSCSSCCCRFSGTGRHLYPGLRGWSHRLPACVFFFPVVPDCRNWYSLVHGDTLFGGNSRFTCVVLVFGNNSKQPFPPVSLSLSLQCLFTANTAS